MSACTRAPGRYYPVAVTASNDLRWTALTVDDVPALTALLNRIDAAEEHGEPAEEPSIREWLTMPGQDLPDGSIAVREGDRLIGFGMADVTPSLDPDGQARCNLSGGVDPAARRRGIGTRLYEQLEQRAVALATERHPGAPAVLRTAGGVDPTPGTAPRRQAPLHPLRGRRPCRPPPRPRPPPLRAARAARRRARHRAPSRRTGRAAHRRRRRSDPRHGPLGPRRRSRCAAAARAPRLPAHPQLAEDGARAAGPLSACRQHRPHPRDRPVRRPPRTHPRGAYRRLRRPLGLDPAHCGALGDLVVLPHRPLGPVHHRRRARGGGAQLRARLRGPAQIG